MCVCVVGVGVGMRGAGGVNIMQLCKCESVLEM